MWNGFVRNNPLTTDRAIPAACRAFITKYGPVVVEQELRRDWALHLFNLWDFGLLSGPEVTGLIEAADAFVS